MNTMQMRLAILRLRVADLQRWMQLPTLTRAFNQLEWDENLHPRGAGGKFVGGAGLAKALEVVHLEKALKGLDIWAKTQSAETVAAAKARITWRGVKGYDALQARLGHLRYDAMQLGKAAQHANPSHTRELLELREYYRRRQIGAHMNPAAFERMSRTVKALDQHLTDLGEKPDAFKGRAVRMDPDIVAQIEKGIAADATRTNAPTTTNTKPLRAMLTYVAHV